MAVLTLLKVLGLFAGFVVGLLELRATKGEDSRVDRRRHRLALRVLVCGLFVAVAAELVDTFLKQRDTGEALARNNQLLTEIARAYHPLFPMRVLVSVAAPLNTPRLAPYLQQLLDATKDDDDRIRKRYSGFKEGDLAFPGVKSPAYAILTAKVKSYVLIYSASKPPATLDGTNSGAAISFGLTRSPRVNDKSPHEPPGSTSEWQRVGSMSTRTYQLAPEDDELLFNDGYSHIEYSDVTSPNNEVISKYDLLGATLQVMLCPDGGAVKIPQDLHLDYITIMLPGRQEIDLTNDSKSVVNTRNCESRYYSLPKSREKFESLLSP